MVCAVALIALILVWARKVVCFSAKRLDQIAMLFLKLREGVDQCGRRFDKAKCDFPSALVSAHEFNTNCKASRLPKNVEKAFGDGPNGGVRVPVGNQDAAQ